MREVADTALRLTDEEFDGLIQAEGPDAPELADVSPGVLVALEAVQAPLAAVQIDVSSRRHVQQHQLWVNESSLGMLLDVKDDERQLTAAPPDLLPSSIARLIGLGPRRVGARAARVADPEVVHDLHDESELLRGSSFDVLGMDWAWRIEASLPGDSLALAGVDGADGLWLVARDPEKLLLEPTTATSVWRLLTRLLSLVSYAYSANQIAM